MTSKFGDKYDHISDIIKFIGIIYILYIKLPSDKFKIFILIGSILLILSASHLGCQEKIYNNSENGDMLALTKLLCITDPEKQIKFTRYFGCGTFILFVVGFIFII
jgi:phosphatidylglycerophosphate synthase